jgi:quinol monooxygenase YgiN
VLVEYRVPEANTAAFVRAMEEVGHLRRRDGCWRWDLFEDVADPTSWFETFTLASWFDYLRQRRRATAADEAAIAAARALLDPGFAPWCAACSTAAATRRP